MSRRFKGRHGKVKAQPNAKPEPPVELTDENSHVDQFYPDIRYPNQLNARAFVRATSTPRPAPKKAEPSKSVDPPPAE
jgi:hypothetical protein